MKIAVISDIHSNLYSLEAVLKDIENKGISNIYCTGDLVGYHTRPNEVISLIKEKNVKCILGNHDHRALTGKIVSLENLSEDDLKKAIIRNYSIRSVSNESLEFLKTLPESLVINLNGKKIRFVHGSPRSISEYLKEDSVAADEVMSELVEDVLICGHTHKAYTKEYGEKILINAGSIGKPKKGVPEAEYVILDFSEDKLNISFENVSYDVEKIAKEILESELPDELVTLLRTGGKK